MLPFVYLSILLLTFWAYIFSHIVFLNRYYIWFVLKVFKYRLRLLKESIKKFLFYLCDYFYSIILCVAFPLNTQYEEKMFFELRLFLINADLRDIPLRTKIVDMESHYYIADAEGNSNMHTQMYAV